MSEYVHLIEAAAIAIDALWSDGDKREIAFSQTERSYQDHCRSTARAALLAASSLRGDGEVVGWAGPDELAYLKQNPMSNATMWGASRGPESSIALYASPPLVTEGGTVGFDADDIRELQVVKETLETIEYVARNDIKAHGMKTIWDLAQYAQGPLGRLLSETSALSNTPHKEGLRAEGYAEAIRDAAKVAQDAAAKAEKIGTRGLRLSRKHAALDIAAAIEALTSGAQNGR